MADENFEIQLDTVGAEAVQQTLDALGVQAEQINTTAAGDATAGPEASVLAPGSAGQAPASFSAPDLAGVLAALDRTNDLLASILQAIETRPLNSQPTY